MFAPCSFPCGADRNGRCTRLFIPVLCQQSFDHLLAVAEVRLLQPLDDLRKID
jgi:hypothetical protein